MREFNSALVKNERLLPGIHGLRGIASLAIVLLHLQHLAKIEPPAFFEFIGQEFRYSVHLFFILSAFSLMYSTEPRMHRPDWLSDYFIKRFFRIAPLYYFMMVFEIARRAFVGGAVPDSAGIVLNLTFTFGFVPVSGMVWAGWAVGVEMIFYAIFPVLLLTIRTPRSALAFLIISIVVSCAIRSLLHAQYIIFPTQPNWGGEDWSYFSFGSNICFFAMGIYAFRARQQLKKEYILRIIIPLITMTLIGWLLFFDGGKYFYGSGRGDLVLWGLILAALCLWQSAQPNFILAHGLLQYVGERSFSLYLVHPVAISFLKGFLFARYEELLPFIGPYAFFVCAMLLLAVLLILTELTYRLIEVPGIHLGRRLIVLKRNYEDTSISQI